MLLYILPSVEMIDTVPPRFCAQGGNPFNQLRLECVNGESSDLTTGTELLRSFYAATAVVHNNLSGVVNTQSQASSEDACLNGTQPFIRTAFSLATWF